MSRPLRLVAHVAALLVPVVFAAVVSVGCAAPERGTHPADSRAADPSSVRGAPLPQGPEGFAPPPYLDARGGRDAGRIARAPVRHPSELRRRERPRGTAPTARRGRPGTVVLDVRDLLWAPPSFTAPELGVLPSGATFGVEGSRESGPRWSEEALLDAIRAAVAPGTWDEDGNSIEIVDGKLVVTRNGPRSVRRPRR